MASSTTNVQTSEQPMKLAQAYAYCLDCAHSHYENFPVASIIVPKRLRPSIAVIYTFARQADDIADEGDATPDERIKQLNEYSDALDTLNSDDSSNQPVFIALKDVIKQHQLPIKLFHDLLSAFTQDVSKKRYQDETELLDYCRRSANPVGRLLLHLYKENSADNLKASDAICSALQLINFLQDIEQDITENNRLYLPLDDLKSHQVSEQDVITGTNSTKMTQLLDQQMIRAWQLLEQGAPLTYNIRGRLGFELRLTLFGGLRILHKRYRLRDNITARPRLSWQDWLWVVWQAITFNKNTKGLPALGIPQDS